MTDRPRHGLRTRMVHGGQLRTGFEETAEALFLTSGYVYGSAAAHEAAFANDGSRYVYSRYRNPTTDMFEARLADLEGARFCFGVGSGMAAVHTALAALVRAGDRVVAGRALFGSCSWILNDLLPRWSVEVVLVDGEDDAQWQAALGRPARLVFVETPSNPMLTLVDLSRVAGLARAAGAVMIVDNVFATPLLQKPLGLGADIVVYSATKHIDGQGRVLGGAVLTDREDLAAQIRPFLRHTGPALSPFNAWTLLKGLETLPLRLPAMAATALEVAKALEGLPGVARVLYPGLPSHPQHALAQRQMAAGGTLVAFEVAGGREAAFAFLDRLRLIRLSNNLGDAKSLICHPATTTHQRLTDAERAAVGIGAGAIRLSVGLEDAADLIADLAQALGG